MAQLPTIKLNKETLGLVIACFSVCGTMFGVYNWMLSGRAENSPIVRELLLKDQKQDQRLDRTDEDRVKNTEALKEQTAETQKLKEAVVKLTTVIESNGVTKKAEYNNPSHQAVTLEVQ
jgi:hypothetical protein